MRKNIDEGFSHSENSDALNHSLNKMAKHFLLREEIFASAHLLIYSTAVRISLADAALLCTGTLVLAHDKAANTISFECDFLYLDLQLFFARIDFFLFVPK